MERTIYKKLLNWKNKSNGKTALLIEGARRIGKTYIAEVFGSNEYKNYIKIDFSSITKEELDIFKYDKNNLQYFFNKLQIINDVKLYERNSLIIFDEVQLYPEARQMIKSLVSDGRYDYIETGSLISLHNNVKNILIPSEEEHIKMYPMSFEEFLMAMDEKNVYEYIKDCYEKFVPLGQAIHRKVLNLFRQYMLIGGMPMSVLKYMENNDFEESELAKKNVLQLYREDINKFSGKDITKVKATFDLIPNQLQRKSKRIKYSEINKSARGRRYYDTFKFLEDSMMVNMSYNVTDPNVALELSVDDENRKCYMSDTGILVTMCLSGSPYIDSDTYKNLLFDKLYVNEGMFAENIVAQSLVESGYKLYHYKKTDNLVRKNNIEIDFLLNDSNGLNVVEVKSSNYRKHSSLDKFMRKFGKRINNAYILYDKDIKEVEGIKHLPIYMASFL